MGAFTTRARELWDRLLRAYDTVQVELHGQYSLARLKALTQHMAQGADLSCGRCALAIAVVVLTPVPCLLTILLLNAAPLHTASGGVRDQTVWLWVRVAFSTIAISFCTIQQLRQSTPSLPMPAARLAVILLVLGVAGTAEYYALGEFVGFPTPFAMQLIMMLWFPKIATALWLSWRRALEQDAVARGQLARYLIAQSSEVAIALVYPVYYYVFIQLSGSQQTMFSLVLPILKLGFRNWVNSGVLHMEDLAPVVIVFNIDVFHALFLSTTTQTSKSMGTVAIVMAVDVLQTCVALVQVHHVMVLYDQTDAAIRKNVAARHPEAPVAVLCSLSPLASVQRILATCPRVCAHPGLALPRHVRLRPHNVAVPEAVAGAHPPTRWIASIGSIANGFKRVFPASHLMLLPQLPTKTGSPSASPPLTELEMLEIQAVVYMLKVLHMVEFYVLIEFAEFAMAAIYAIYLFAMAALPNRVHYANLATLTPDELRANAEYVTYYAVMELFSFLVLCYLFDKKLQQFSTIGQLAFVLQTHWQMAQASLVLWVLFVTQLPLAHSGTDYSFKFAWLNRTVTV